jgi:uncharacterized membrane protein
LPGNREETNMAQKIILIDDLDGTEAEQTLHYTVDGQEYEIDLSGKNAASFYQALQPYIDKSREVELPVVTPRRTTRRSTGTAPASRTDSAQVRAWATARGIEVNPRGRIKKEILEQYQAEMSGQRTQTVSASSKRNGQDPASEQPA